MDSKTSVIAKPNTGRFIKDKEDTQNCTKLMFDDNLRFLY